MFGIQMRLVSAACCVASIRGGGWRLWWLIDQWLAGRSKSRLISFRLASALLRHVCQSKESVKHGGSGSAGGGGCLAIIRNVSSGMAGVMA
jgi:hypothetical protein